MKVVGIKELVLYCIILSLLQLKGGADSIPSCTDNEVRLVGGSGEWEGNVQICYNGKWGAVCDNGWDDQETQVVCRQLLGYSAPTAGLYRYRLRSYYGYQGTEPAVLDFVNCKGTEKWLSECSALRSTIEEGMRQPLGSCSPSNMVGVYCGYNKTCADGAVRLVHDQSGMISIGRSEGRVEVCHENRWKNICSKPSWSNNEAKVVCRQLGFSGTSAEGFSDKENTYGPGFLPYAHAFSNVSCSGLEESIFKCSRSPNNLCINSYSIAAVRCYTNTEDMSCSPNDDIRLYNTFSNDTIDNHEGILQTCINGTWHSVCHDSAAKKMSNAVCIKLGFKGAIDHRSNAGLYYGYTQYYSNHTCTSSDDLSKCTPAPSSSCGYYNKTMGIVCYKHCQDGDLKLNNDTLEICYSNTWGLVSASNWNENNTDVACRDLGYATGRESYSVAGYDNRTIYLHNVTCSGTEQNLISCNSTFMSVSTTMTPNTTVIGLTCEDEQTATTEPPSRHSRAALVAATSSTLSAIIILISSVFLISVIVYVMAVRRASNRRKQTISSTCSMNQDNIPLVINSDDDKISGKFSIDMW